LYITSRQQLHNLFLAMTPSCVLVRVNVYTDMTWYSILITTYLEVLPRHPMDKTNLKISKSIIRRRNSKKRTDKYNGQKQTDNNTNSGGQNTPQETKQHESR